jgi:hypothetical protein
VKKTNLEQRMPLLTKNKGEREIWARNKSISNICWLTSVERKVITGKWLGGGCNFGTILTLFANYSFILQKPYIL